MHQIHLTEKGQLLAHYNSAVVPNVNDEINFDKTWMFVVQQRFFSVDSYRVVLIGRSYNTIENVFTNS